jgi:hypothetical protein
MSDIQTRADLSGLTASECAKACNIDRCVISGRGYCMHPRKAPMPPALADNPEVQSAWTSACEILLAKKQG